MAESVASLVERLILFADKANEVVTLMNHGGKWRMRVPANLDDPDLIISELVIVAREAASRLAEGTRENMITETEYGPCPLCGGNGQTINTGGTALYITCTRCSGTGQIITRTVTRQSTPPASPSATNDPFSKTWSEQSQRLDPDSPRVSAASRPAQTCPQCRATNNVHEVLMRCLRCHTTWPAPPAPGAQEKVRDDCQ